MITPPTEKYQTIVQDLSEITNPPFMALYAAVSDLREASSLPDVAIDPYTRIKNSAHEPTDFHKRQASRVLAGANHEFKAYATAQVLDDSVAEAYGISLEPVMIPVGDYGTTFAKDLVRATSIVANAVEDPRVQEAIDDVLDDNARAVLFANHTFQGRRHANNLHRGMNQLIAQSVVNTAGAVSLLSSRYAEIWRTGEASLEDLAAHQLPSRMAQIVGSHSVSTMVDYGYSFAPWLEGTNFSVAARKFLRASAEIPREEAQKAAQTLQGIEAGRIAFPKDEAAYTELLYKAGQGRRCPAAAKDGGIAHATNALRIGFSVAKAA